MMMMMIDDDDDSTILMTMELKLQGIILWSQSGQDKHTKHESRREYERH
jgi:hypothetical protein